MPFVYLILNSANGKCYVGKADDINVRWKNHCRISKVGIGPLYRAMRKYGLNYFSVIMLEETQEAYEAEAEWIKYLRWIGAELYNLNDGDRGGVNPSSETLERHRQSKIGKKFSESHRNNIKKAAKNRPPVSEETKRKIGQASKGRCHSLAARKKISNAAKNNGKDLEPRAAKQEHSQKLNFCYII